MNVCPNCCVKVDWFRKQSMGALTVTCSSCGSPLRIRSIDMLIEAATFLIGAALTILDFTPADGRYLPLVVGLMGSIGHRTFFARFKFKSS
jgi:hypothetical protein